MWIGWLEFDLLLGDVRSLKQKRSLVRPVIAELHRKFGVSAAETGSQELHRRAGIGVAMASADRSRTPGGGASGVRVAVGAPRSATQRRLTRYTRRA
jgi:uncharacterized protein YlxP (DUF503 family)